MARKSTLRKSRRRTASKRKSSKVMSRRRKSVRRSRRGRRVRHGGALFPAEWEPLVKPHSLTRAIMTELLANEDNEIPAKPKDILDLLRSHERIQLTGKATDRNQFDWIRTRMPKVKNEKEAYEQLTSTLIPESLQKLVDAGLIHKSGLLTKSYKIVQDDDFLVESFFMQKLKDGVVEYKEPYRESHALRNSLIRQGYMI